jgi:two-component system, NarL family, response regulator NreC
VVSTNIVAAGVTGQTAAGPGTIVPESVPGPLVAGPADSTATNVRRRITTVLLIDQPGIPRDGLCALLESDSSLQVIAVVAGRREAVRALRAAQPHVVVMDLSVDLLQGRETIIHIKRRWPRVGVLVLVQPGREHIETALRAGADGYVLLDEECAELFNAVRRIASGRGYLSPATLDRMVTSYRGSTDPGGPRSAAPEVLTGREREVIAMIAKGYRTREMAQLLCLSHKTVEKHRANLMRKLGLRSAAAAAAYAITHGLGEGADGRGSR